jgi:dienelactone hydrolase
MSDTRIVPLSPVKKPGELMRRAIAFQLVAVLLASLHAGAPAVAQERGFVSVVIDRETVRLVTVTYKPDGEGPFPTLIFHHGSGGFRGPPPAVAQWFVARGWAVIAPARRGRGGSEGADQEGATCSLEAAGKGAERALSDIEAATPLLLSQPFVDRDRIAVGGQSRGGILAVAWSGRHPEMRAVVNFVGGWVGELCRSSNAINRDLLERGIAGGQTSLWLYGDNDRFYSLAHTRADWDAYGSKGGHAEWRDYKPSEEVDGHQIANLPGLWSDDLEAYLAARGLPAWPLP